MNYATADVLYIDHILCPMLPLSDTNFKLHLKVLIWIFLPISQFRRREIHCRISEIVTYRLTLIRSYVSSANATPTQRAEREWLLPCTQQGPRDATWSERQGSAEPVCPSERERISKFPFERLLYSPLPTPIPEE